MLLVLIFQICNNKKKKNVYKFFWVFCRLISLQDEIIIKLFVELKLNLIGFG